MMDINNGVFPTAEAVRYWLDAMSPAEMEEYIAWLEEFHKESIQQKKDMDDEEEF